MTTFCIDYNLTVQCCHAGNLELCKATFTHASKYSDKQFITRIKGCYIYNVGSKWSMMLKFYNIFYIWIDNSLISSETCLTFIDI